MFVSIRTQANYATAVAPAIFSISGKNGRAGYNMHAVPQYLSVRHDRGKMFSINCAEPCTYRSVLKLIMLQMLPRPYETYLARMAEQDMICTRFRNIYQCGSWQRKNVFNKLCGTMFVSIHTQANYAMAVAPAICSISGKNGRAGCDMHAVPQYLSVRFVTEEICFQ